MKKISIIISVVILVCVEAMASDFSAVCPSGQTLYYNIVSSTDHTVAITYPGSYLNDWTGYVKPSGHLVIPATVDYGGQPHTVVKIDGWAFANCGSLSGVTIPNTITEIGGYSFYYCGITSITIPNTVNYIQSNAFYGNPCYNIVIENPNIILEKDVFHNTTWYNNQPAGVRYIGTVLYAYKGTISSPSQIAISANTTSIAGGAFYQQSNLSSISFPNSLKTIGYQAFYACGGLTTLTIPSSVECIARNAFGNCGELTTVNWNAINCTNHIGNFSNGSFFEGCDNFTILNVGDGVVNIPDYAFYSCNLSGNLLLPSSTTIIGKSAFEGCSGLSSITLPNDINTLGDYAFRYCIGISSITLPQNLDSIGSCVFGNCTNLQTVNYNAINCQHISYGLFDYCNNLTTFNIGSGVQVIPHHICYNLSQLSGTLTFPNSLKSISDYAFSGCAGITGSLVIPDSVETIGAFAFRNCSGISSLTIGKSLNSIGSGALNMSGLTTINYNATNCLPSDNIVFSNSEISTFNIGSNVQTIPDGLVFNCPNLTTVMFPTALTRIGANAFSACGLTGAITIPSNVNTIGYGAFSNVIAISDVICQNTTPPVVETYMGIPYIFSYCTNKPLHVPCESISAYKSAPGWNNFTDISGIGSCFYTVNLSVNNSSMGIVRGSGQYEQGTVVTCEAEPYNGYHFERWSDNNTQNPRNITVNNDITLIAYFASNVGISDLSSSGLLLNGRNGSIQIRGVKGQRITIYNIDGRIIDMEESISGDVTIPVPSNGIYLVKIGDCKIYKILVLK